MTKNYLNLSPNKPESTKSIFTKFSELVDTRVGVINPTFVLRSLEECCYGNQSNLLAKTDIDCYHLHSLHRRSTTKWNIAILVRTMTAGMMGLHCLKFGELPSSNFADDGAHLRTCVPLQSEKRPPPSFVALAFRNGFEYRNLDLSMLIGNHLVKFGSVIPKFKQNCKAGVDNFTTISSATFVRGRSC